MSGDVKLNHAAIGELLHSDEVADFCEQLGDKVAARAREIAPVVSGDYRDSIYVERRESTQRAWTKVGARVPYSLKVEADHGTLVSALGAAGE